MTVTVYEMTPGVISRLTGFNFDKRVSKMTGNLNVTISGVQLIQQVNDEDVTLYRNQYDSFSMDYDEYSEIVIS